jgi:hypothetical protein
MPTRREAAVEARLRDEMTRRGCVCYKFVSPGNNGVPDRMIIAPHGEIIFIELKTERGRLSASQKAQIRRLRDHGATVYVLYGADDVDSFLRHFDSTRR